jgi:O-antigen ligase
VTALAEHALEPTLDLRQSRLRASVTAHAGEAATWLAAAWWLIVVTRHWAGREAGVVSIGALLLLPAVVLARPWRWLPTPALYLAGAVSIAALAVALSAPTGWSGAPVAAAYVCAAWLAVCVAAVGRRAPDAVARLSVLVSIAALVEFAEAWLPWWGSEDPTRPLLGTFYWHDPFAAFLLPGAALALWQWNVGTRLVRLVGGLTLCLGAIGIVYSTSRATLACLGMALLLTVAIGLGDSGRLRWLLRSGGGLVLAAAATYFVAGPPFFPHHQAAVAGIQQRAAGQSLGQNGGYRLEFWREALNLFTRHPWSGGGYHSLATESAGRVPHGWAISPFAHSGYLQPLADGGLLLAVPFLLACAGVAWLVVTSLVSAVRSRSTRTLGVALAVAVAAVMTHSAVDFDWTYAANLALFGLLAGLLFAARPVTKTSRTAGQPRRAAVGFVTAVAAVTLVLSAIGARHGDLRENLSPHGASAVQAASQSGR